MDMAAEAINMLVGGQNMLQAGYSLHTWKYT